MLALILLIYGNPDDDVRQKISSEKSKILPYTGLNPIPSIAKMK